MDAGEYYVRHMDQKRYARVFAYMVLVVAGICAFGYPSELVADQVHRTVLTIWALCMVLSSSVCLYGSITDRWIGEYSGLPLLASVLMLYGLSAIFGVQNNRSMALLAYGLVVVAFALFLIARWRDVQAVLRQAVMLGAQNKGE